MPLNVKMLKHLVKLDTSNVQITLVIKTIVNVESLMDVLSQNHIWEMTDNAILLHSMD